VVEILGARGRRLERWIFVFFSWLHAISQVKGLPGRRVNDLDAGTSPGSLL